MGRAGRFGGNAAAVGFYQACGFVAKGRSEFDETGRPDPLLHMRRAAPRFNMIDQKTRVVIRRFDAARDAASLQQCVIDQQDVHRNIEPSWPDGDAIVGAYVTYLETECAARNGRILMAHCGKLAVGFVCVVAMTRGESPDDPAPFAWIHDIYVKPGHRQRGVASMLMAEAERFASGEGAQSVRLGVLDGNERARRFYGRRGFREYTHVLTKPLA